MKREKLRHYANVLSSHADAHWVTPAFFFLFFIDSFIMFIPVDSLLAATITLRPQHIKKWLTAAILGFALGLGIATILANSHLQPLFLHYFEKWGYLQHVEDAIAHAQDYGYIELTIGVFTVLPSIFGVVIGVLLHLNPWAVWAISLAGKILKLLLTVWVIFTSSKAVKKLLNVYLKTSV